MTALLVLALFGAVQTILLLEQHKALMSFYDAMRA
jgi:hypothetical protein